MSAYSDSENLDPKLNLEQHDSGIFNGKGQPNLRDYTNSILSTSQKSFHGNQLLNPSLINGSNRNLLLPRGRVPVVKSSDTNSIRSSVKELVLSYALSNDVGILRHSAQNRARAYATPASHVVPYQKAEIEPALSNLYEVKTKHFNFSKAPSPIPETKLDNVPLLELYKTGADESMVESLHSAVEVVETKKDVEQSHLNDPRTSYLNPYQAYVEVSPPRLGQPLAKKGTPLDLSLVSRNNLASPLFDLEEKKTSDDELKLFSLLNFEISLTEAPVTNKVKGDIESGFEILEFQEQNSFQMSLKHFFQRIFKKGPYSEEELYFKRYPWAKIMNDIDNPKHEIKQVHEVVGQFEKNNTDMFPVNIISSPLEEFSENFDFIRRQKYTFIPKVEQPVK